MIFRNEYEFLSNMFPCLVVTALGTFNCAESAFQAEKCVFNDDVKAFFALSGKEAKAYGKTVKMRPDWNEVRVQKMEMVLRNKFKSPALMVRLKEVHGIIEEENTWNVKFWGVCNGIGENNLGKLLMKLRDEDSEMTNVQMIKALEEQGFTVLAPDVTVRASEEVKYTLTNCANSLNSAVRVNKVVWYVPTALIAARGLKLAVCEMKNNAQEGMKPRWDELLNFLG